MKQRSIKTCVSNLLLTEKNGFLVELNFVDNDVFCDDSSAVLHEAEKQINEYMGGQRKAFDLPMNFEGTVFQKKVWEAMLEIPYGKVCSYAQIAQRIQNPKASRAVGNACNKNPIAIIVPCHRVVASNHKLGGFAFGIDCKLRLHAIENIKL